MNNDTNSSNNKQIGAILKAKRLEMGYTHEDIYQALKIRSNIVDNLEESSWEYLERHIYLANFSKQYVKFLKIEDDEIVEKINSYTKANHSMHDFPPIDTFKNTGKELKISSSRKNNKFSMKKKNSSASNGIITIVIVVVLIVIIGIIFAYKQGLFSDTKSLVNNYTSKLSSKDKKKNIEKKSDGDGEKIKIIKLTTDDKTHTIVEEDPKKNSAIKVENNDQATATEDQKKIDDAKKLEDDEKVAEQKLADEKLAELEKAKNDLNLTLVAVKDVWVYVKNKKSDKVLTGKILKRNEEFKIPTGENLYLSVSSPYDVKGTFGTKTFKHLGKRDKVINLLKINKKNLNRIIR